VLRAKREDNASKTADVPIRTPNGGVGSTSASAARSASYLAAERDRHREAVRQDTPLHWGGGGIHAQGAWCMVYGVGFMAYGVCGRAWGVCCRV